LFIRSQRRADYNMQLAARLCEQAKTLKDEDKLALMIPAIDYLAPHGENEAVRVIMAEIKPLLPADQYEAFQKTVDIREDWQRHFQLKAAGLYETTLDQVDADKRAETLYLCGELYRRAGQPEKARGFFKTARASSPAPAVLALIDAQETRLPRE
jgi:hypothetical protein